MDLITIKIYREPHVMAIERGVLESEGIVTYALHEVLSRYATMTGGVKLQVAESDANFVLFGRFEDRHAVWQALLDRGVLIRETGPDGWLRVSAGTPTEMQAFKDALTAVLGTEIEKEIP